MGLTSAQIIAKYGLPEGVETADPSKSYAPVEETSAVKFRNSINPAKPDTSEGVFGRRLQDIARGSNQVEELAGGAIFVIGKITVPGLASYGEDFAIQAGRGVILNSPRVGSLSETKNFGDILEYGSEVLLEAIPLFVVSMLLVLLIRKFCAW